MLGTGWGGFRRDAAGVIEGGTYLAGPLRDGQLCERRASVGRAVGLTGIGVGEQRRQREDDLEERESG